MGVHFLSLGILKRISLYLLRLYYEYYVLYSYLGSSTVYRSFPFSPWLYSSILDSTGKKLFTVYLVHSLPLEMSAVQLFVGARMAVVAHLVGADTVGADNEDLGIGPGREVT